MTGENPLLQLSELGQSVWLDYITREILDDGTLQKLIDEDGLRGMTTNPTIFSKAVRSGERYDEDLRRASPERDVEEVFLDLAVQDVQRAADFFRPVYDATGGTDGLVSIEARPTLARDTEGTIAEARRLWSACDRPNVMIKIPGTAEGLPAIETCLAEGINVNITLLFSVERYRQVMNAWRRAMERRLGEGLPLEGIASVASFFVSRVDVLMDERLDQILAGTESEETRRQLKAVRSRLGVYNARRAYRAFEETFATEPYEILRDRGAQVQRPLWASTSTKDPALADIYYVEELAAPDSVNTLPPHTLDAYRDHGEPQVRIRKDLAAAEAAFQTLERHDIDFAAATRRLEEEGVDKFTASYEELLETISSQRAALQKA